MNQINLIIMKHIGYLISALLFLSSCEIHDEVTTSVTPKAKVSFRYHYNNGNISTLRDIQSMRLFIYDSEGKIYRDTLFSVSDVLSETPISQTYLIPGEYTFISWANLKNTSVLNSSMFTQASLSHNPNAVDQLFYGKIETSIAKGDDLYYDINLFKSVFKINVQITGLKNANYPESHYFGIYNYTNLDFFNRPWGDKVMYKPQLTYENGQISGSFYTPYFNVGDDLKIGIYTDNPELEYTTMYETSIRNFVELTEAAIGRDVEITIKIEIRDSGINLTVSDWEGVIIQEEHLGK